MPVHICYFLCCQSEHGILFDLFHATDNEDQKFSERRIHNGLSAKKQYKNSIGLIFKQYNNSNYDLLPLKEKNRVR